ncbi:MAG: hypothetical protein O7C59_05975 [Rickettsia endosymbiont of Ixodes persulcatus]|nr:hypothetical protein [Rickettsia endosymbiont of Ixodes persulcatus]MCZ6902100.1 hypothetical protein [Rickettsia endosymbiont of Ixodes persulcatus]MCZ6902855.1 hypothetical protein [Rickettsia endosymbiont of Ixodes persulcatus]MCZ6909049.1 hypothetical protein [Rickettsia endosymbiont of Ixodes persulcatus]MCZ6910845.1 hypothetical protein [Rickettsia endosymbiont of Ixodes persulcatus]
MIFGWIGDNIGRKATIVITTAIMRFSCIVSYGKCWNLCINRTAATWIVTICRILQGMSSMG